MKVKKLVLTAILSSLSIVLYEFLKFSFVASGFIKFQISLGIIPIFFIAYYCGTIYSVIASIIVDVLGILIFNPKDFNIGFTIGALIGGLVIGLILNSKKDLNNKKGLLLIIILMGIISLLTLPLYTLMYFKAGIGSKLNNAGYIIPILGLISNIIVIIYSFINYKKDESNKIIIAYILYQFFVSLIINPLSISLMYNIDFFSLWIDRLITAPLILIGYSLITKLILKVLNVKYKK